MKIKLFCALSLAFFVENTLWAQQELMLNALPDVWHSTSTNPAFFPGNKTLAIGLPGYALDAAHSGDIAYRDVFVKNGDRRVIDFSNALSKLAPENRVNFDQRIETVSLGFRLPGKMWLQAGHANRFGGNLTYPKALPSLIWGGNAQYIGQTVEVAPTADLSNWNEWSVGIAKEMGKLNVGIRAKYLTGVAALRSDPDHRSAKVTTSDDIYQLSLSADYGFYASSFISAIDTSGLGFDLQFADLNGKAFSKNSGYAFDLGAQFKVNEKWTLDLSLLDLGGKIRWKQNSQYFISQGEYTYEGVNFPGADIINGSDSLDFSTKLDTLNDIFNFQRSAQTFETKLPFRGYVGARFALNKHWGFGLSAYFQKRDDEKATVAVGANARWSPLRWLSVGAMYSLNARSAANIGCHLVVKPGPVQLYFASDNLLNAFSIRSNPAANLRAGLSLVF